MDRHRNGQAKSSNKRIDSLVKCDTGRPRPYTNRTQESLLFFTTKRHKAIQASGRRQYHTARWYRSCLLTVYLLPMKGNNKSKRLELKRNTWTERRQKNKGRYLKRFPFFCVAFFFLFCQYIYIVHVQLVIYSLQSRGPYRSIEGHRAFCFLLDISSHTGSFASALLLLYSRPSRSEYKVHTSEKSQSAISTNRDLIFPFAPFFLSFLFALYQINSRKLYLVYRTRLQKKNIYPE